MVVAIIAVISAVAIIYTSVTFAATSAGTCAATSMRRTARALP